MMTTTGKDDEERIAEIARLLHHAADLSWEQASAQGPRSTLHLLGLGIQVAASQTATLLPAHLDPYGPAPARPDDVLGLLRAAEQLARSVPVADTAGFSAIVVSIGDLVRQASA